MNINELRNDIEELKKYRKFLSSLVKEEEKEVEPERKGKVKKIEFGKRGNKKWITPRQ